MLATVLRTKTWVSHVPELRGHRAAAMLGSVQNREGHEETEEGLSDEQCRMDVLDPRERCTVLPGGKVRLTKVLLSPNSYRHTHVGGGCLSFHFFYFRDAGHGTRPPAGQASALTEGPCTVLLGPSWWDFLWRHWWWPCSSAVACWKRGGGDAAVSLWQLALCPAAVSRSTSALLSYLTAPTSSHCPAAALTVFSELCDCHP